MAIRNESLKTNLTGYAFISPFIIGFLAFTLIPMFISLYLSFTSYNLFTSPRWIGLGNFEKMFTNDPKYWNSVRVTIYYVFVGVPLRLAFALFVAMVLNTASRMVGTYRTIYYLPSIIGGSVAVSIMWRNIFSEQGIVNHFLMAFGAAPVNWFGNATAALGMLITLSVWQFGSSMLIFLAGLKNISPEMYEAASVDGASPVRKFMNITLPLLSPVILFNLIMQTISAFMTFVPAYVISKGEGGPLDGTMLYSLYLFRQAFMFNNMGYAAAMAWVMLIFIGILTFVLFKTSKMWVFYESEGGR
ncbi:sugar ABC transporter permease [Paenibacillus sp. PsM32]|uniref:Carbohydrate ABC transporter permease n=2 Tax=Paenibacillus TaxID=44249 RepID=A0ABW4UM67_9BACL|nr:MULTISPECIES: sugar ABC transporter permease [Paenibacillus]MDN4619316.1 sugar ABC transporter permease [Paenibacillus sp. PsM32]MDQ1237150.1 multiple sugar transport system permease protein [Paenibacillus sp. SORGH_AS_0306]MDR6109509.1 multiple sugar transport system permease protein [Paenibacillus sp. SORGH_AS_0338]WCT56510.1 sugar ABC transporter permease [Paenibacillus kyungheensis]WDF50380.1 sugar ABC transporter permease [Paenibacillus sp. KACC 21273]